MKQTNIKAIKSTQIKLFRKTMNYSGLFPFFKSRHTDSHETNIVILEAILQS